jgi:hypothetical protein
MGNVPLKVTVLEPKLMVPPDEFEIDPIEAEKFEVLNVPLLTFNVLTFIASARDIAAVDPLSATPMFSVVTPGKVFPFDVMEKEPEVAKRLTVAVPGFVSVMVVENIIPPWTLNVVLVNTSVPVNPVQFKLRHTLLLRLRETLTVPDAALRNTSSAEVGTDAPPVPPDVVAHLVPAVPSHVAVPPTQYLSAMFKHPR